MYVFIDSDKVDFFVCVDSFWLVFGFIVFIAFNVFDLFDYIMVIVV